MFTITTRTHSTQDLEREKCVCVEFWDKNKSDEDIQFRSYRLAFDLLTVMTEQLCWMDQEVIPNKYVVVDMLFIVSLARRK